MRGRGLRKVLLVGETEGSLRHFMLRRLLNRAGLPEDYFFFAHLYEPLNELIKANGIRAVVALGEKPLRQLVGESDIERWRGRVVPHPMGIWTIPTFSPAKLMNYRGNTESVDSEIMRHPPRFHGVWIRDIHEALKVAKDGFTRKPGNYLLDPTPEEFGVYAESYFQQLVQHPEHLWLSWDIETVYKRPGDDEEELDAELLNGTILRISFSFEPYTGVSVPWAPSYEPTIRRLLASAGRMVVWNGSTFDVPVVQKAGYPVKGIVYDFMDLFHLYQSDLPKGLEWVSSFYTDLLPWKHLANASPVLYSAIDADAALRNAIGIEKDLRALNQWDLAEKHVVKLMPLLADAGERGNLIDLEKRTEIRTRLLAMKQELIDEAQTFVPRELKPRHLFKTQPDEIEGSYPVLRTKPDDVAVRDTAGGEWDIRFEAEDSKFCSICLQPASNKTEHYKGSAGPLNPKTGKPTKVKNPCKVAGGEIVKLPAFVPRFYRIENFNANSSDQMLAYMKFFGHEVGQDKRDSSKETADAGHLKKMVKAHGAKHPIYANSLELHKATKTIGTYTPEPDAEGLLHTQYVNSTSTWRLGSRKVAFGTQIQNWGKREENKYAKEARKQIIARPRRKLVQVDSSAVEAVMQGYFMNDVNYMGLASKSIHAWLACKALGLEFTPENVEKVKKDHEGLYLKMKVTNYLTNFGGGDYLLWQTFPENFPTRRDATAAQDSLYALLPTLKAYHHSVRWEAHKKTYLENPWGVRHYYYDVFKPTPDGKIEFGKDAKRCVALKPQGSNASFQRDNLLLLGYSPIEGKPYTVVNDVLRDWEILERAYKRGETWGTFMPTNASVHDSACLDCPNELVDRAAETELAIFTRPIPEMKGLRIGAEVEAGSNWAGAGKDNPGGMDRIAKLVIESYDYSTTEAGMAPAFAQAA